MAWIETRLMLSHFLPLDLGLKGNNIGNLTTKFIICNPKYSEGDLSSNKQNLIPNEGVIFIHQYIHNHISWTQ